MEGFPRLEQNRSDVIIFFEENALESLCQCVFNMYVADDCAPNPLELVCLRKKTKGPRVDFSTSFHTGLQLRRVVGDFLPLILRLMAHTEIGAVMYRR